MNPYGINEKERDRWWSVWRKKHEVPDECLYYLAFIAGWHSGVKFNDDRLTRGVLLYDQKKTRIRKTT